jgi:rhodanese-related sulfurtransferase
MKEYIKEASLILIAIILIVILFNTFSSNSIPWVTEEKVKSESANNSELGLDSSSSIDTKSNLNTKEILLSQQDSLNRLSQNINNDSSKNTNQLNNVKDSLKLFTQKQDSIKKIVLKQKLDSLKSLKSIKNLSESTKTDNVINDEIINCDKIKEINTIQAKQLFDKKVNVMFVDARPETQYNDGHIAGSIHAYGDQFAPNIPKFLSMPKDRIFVCYCGGGDECTLSHEAAKGLCQIGFKKVFVYKGGYKEWNENNYPWEK